MRHPRAKAPEAFINGRVMLPLLAMWVAFSCSNWFGLPDIEGLPQVTAERIIFAGAVVYAFVSFAVCRRPLGRLLPVEIGLWVFVFAAGASGIAFGAFSSGYPGSTPDILFKLALFPAVAYSVTLRTTFTERDLKTFLVILTLFGMYLGASALLERSPYAPWLLPPDIADKSIVQHWGRSRGPFLQAEFNGTVMVQLVPALLLLDNARGAASRLLVWITLPLLVAGIYLTETRAALLSLALVLLFGAFDGVASRRVYIWSLGALASAGATLWAFGVPVIPRLGEASSVSDRVDLLLATIGMIVEHPLIGIGFGNFDRYQEQFFLHPRVLGGLSITRRAEFWAGGTHNTWLTPVAELGVVAGGLYLILVLSGLFNALRRTTEASASTPPHGSWGAGLALCSFLTGVAFIVNSSLVELRYTLTPNAMFWVFMALAKTGPRYGPAAFAGRPLA